MGPVIDAKRTPLLTLAILWLLVQGWPCVADTAAPVDLLTASERSWLAAHPRIVLGVGAEWAPDVIQVGEGRIAGFAVDHLRLLADKLGIEIGLEAGPWHAMVAAAESRRLDGLMLAAPLSERRDGFLFTDDFHTVYLFLYQRDGDPLPTPGIAGLAGLRIGYLQDVLRVRRLLAGEPSIVAVPLPSQTALAEALLTGAVDAAIGAYDLEYWRASNGVLGFGPKRMLPEGRARLGISIRKDWPELVGILNKGLAAITEGAVGGPASALVRASRCPASRPTRAGADPRRAGLDQCPSGGPSGPRPKLGAGRVPRRTAPAPGHLGGLSP
jgi:ABC-type amino acid transport substrate-binding protein